VDEKIKQSQKLLVITLTMVLLYGAMVLYHYSEILSLQEGYQDRVEEINVSQFEYIHAITLENYQKATYLAQDMADTLVDDLTTNFSQEDLTYYLTNIDIEDNPLINVIGNNIDHVYLNSIQNDNNDPFVASKRYGIISDFSVNCSSEGRTRTFEEEIELHHNRSLAKQFFQKLVDQELPSYLEGDSAMLGWEFLPSHYNSFISEFNKKNLYKVFLKNGSDFRSLESFEYLAPVYIYLDVDLLGQRVVDANGYSHQANQLIIVQGFNIVDILEFNPQYSKQMNYFQLKRVEVLKLKTIEERHQLVILGILSLTFFIVCIFLLNMYKELEDEILNDSFCSL